MKVALVYDRINKWGGAERVLQALHRMFPKASLYTSVYNRQTASWARPFDIKTSFLQSIKPFRSRNELLPLFMPIAFESFSFDDFDLVISVTSEAAKGIITKPQTLHICYSLTPTRYLWSGYEDYFRNDFVRALATPAVSYLRSWDTAAAYRPDYFIAISNEVKKRIKKYYGRESEVIFPPIMIEKSARSKKSKGEFFLIVSRFSKFSYYKKVNLAIDAFNKTGFSLKIIGSGPMVKDLSRRAKKNIEFLGELTDEDLGSYYENCRALVFPGIEDFGLSMAEAQSYGTPVIAYKGGGAKDIIAEGKTGEFFNEQTVSSLAAQLKRFDERRYNKRDIIKNSERFTFEKFREKLEKLIKEKMIKS